MSVAYMFCSPVCTTTMSMPWRGAGTMGGRAAWAATATSPSGSTWGTASGRTGTQTRTWGRGWEGGPATPPPPPGTSYTPPSTRTQTKGTAGARARGGAATPSAPCPGLSSTPAPCPTTTTTVWTMDLVAQPPLPLQVRPLQSDKKGMKVSIC